MPNPFKCIVTDLPQVFVCTCWALGTVTEDVLHCLFLLPTGTIRAACNSPPVHVLIGLTNFRSCSVECDPIFPTQGCSTW